MPGIILLCTLAAGGLLLLLWAVYGWLSAPFGRENAAVVLHVGSEEQLERELRAWSWLQRSGMAAAPLLICPTPKMRRLVQYRCHALANVRICSGEELEEYIEMELETCSRN